MRARAPAYQSDRLLLSRLRPLLIAAGLIVAWQCVVWVSGVPTYILPGPADVAQAWINRAPMILRHAGVTVLIFGCVAGLQRQ